MVTFGASACGDCGKMYRTGDYHNCDEMKAARMVTFANMTTHPTAPAGPLTVAEIDALMKFMADNNVSPPDTKLWPTIVALHRELDGRNKAFALSTAEVNDADDMIANLRKELVAVKAERDQQKALTEAAEQRLTWAKRILTLDRDRWKKRATNLQKHLGELNDGTSF